MGEACISPPMVAVEEEEGEVVRGEDSTKLLLGCQTLALEGGERRGKYI